MLRLTLDHLGPWSEPVELAGGLGPELLGLFDAAAVHRLILCEALDVGVCGKLRRRRKHPVLPQSRIQIRIAFNRRHAQTSVILSQQNEGTLYNSLRQHIADTWPILN